MQENEIFPWPGNSSSKITGKEIHAHEFHHSAILDPDPDWVYGYEVIRGSGVDGMHDAIVYKNLVAGYVHLRHVGGVCWTERFVAQVRRCKACAALAH